MLTAIGQRTGTDEAISEGALKQQGSEKLLFLESVRGLAALVVVAFHFFRAFHGEWFVSRAGEGWGSILEGSLLLVLLNGAFAVDLFFVLSGFVLSLSFFRSFDRSVVSSAAIRRYFRLLLPVLASVMIAWTIQSQKGFRNTQAAERMQQPPTSWLNGGPKKKIKFFEAVEQGTIGAFFDFDEKKSLNTSLWTMEAELKGSFFVFAFLVLCGSYSRRYLIYGALIILFLVTRDRILLDFLCGVALCDWMMTVRRRGGKFSLGLGWSAALVLSGVVIGAITAKWLASEVGVEMPWDEKRWRALGAVLLLLGILGCPLFQRVLEWRPFLTLGKISFSLYVIHWPILLSLACAVYIVSRDHSWGHGTSVVVAGAVYLPAALVSAWLLYRFTDLPSIRLGKWVEKQLKG